MFPLLMVCLLVIPAGAVSLAVGPSRLTIQNAVPGKDYVREIYVDNTEDADGIFLLGGSGEIASWVAFYPMHNDKQTISQISIPAKGSAYANAKFSIPASASPLVYTGQLLISGAPASIPNGGGAGIQMQLPIEVRIEMVGAPPPQTTAPAAAALPPVTYSTGELNLVSLSYSAHPAAGETAKLQAFLQNLTGADTTAYLVAELYLEGKLVDSVKGEALLVPNLGSVTLTAYYKPLQPGDYTVKAQAIYAGRQTAVREVLMTVSGPASGLAQNLAQSAPQNAEQSNPASISPLLLGGILGAGLIVIGLMVLAFLRDKKKIR
jgi:hypothetical protein